MKVAAPRHKEPPLPPFWALWAIAAALLAATIWTFAPATTHGFVNWDDQTIYPEFLPHPGLNRAGWDWAWSFTGIEWVPLARLAFLAQAELGGPVAQGIHHTSLAVHALNTLLLWWVTGRLLTRRTESLAPWVASGMATLIVMLHPLRAEPVAWAAAQHNLWSTALALLSLVFFRRSWQASAQGISIRTGLGVLLAPLTLAGALLFKPTAMVLFFWFPLITWAAWSSDRGPTSQPRPKTALAIVLILSGILAAGSIGISWHLREEFQSRPGTSLVSLGDLAPRASYALGLYIKNFLWPTELSPFYGPNSQWLPVALVAAVALFATLLLGRKWPSVWLSAAGLGLALLPVLGIARTGRFVAADRYTYFPTMALCPLLAGGVLRLWQRSAPKPWTRIPLLISGIAVTATLAILSRDQVRIWQSSETLWRHALAHGGTQTADIWSNLGGALEESGQFNEALAAYERALTLDPLLPEARLGRAVTLYRLGHLPEAVAAAESTVQLAPNFPLAWQNLASLLLNQKDFDRAQWALTQALDLTPNLPSLHYARAQLEAHYGRYHQALAALDVALEKRPQWTDALVMKGSLLAVMGRPQDGIRTLENILRDHPDHLVAMITLAQIWWSQGELGASMGWLQRAALAHPGTPTVQKVTLDIVKAIPSKVLAWLVLEHYFGGKFLGQPSFPLFDVSLLKSSEKI